MEQSGIFYIPCYALLNLEIMYEKLQKYKCGGCGNENYNIYQEEGNKQRIITECTKCKSQTEITIRPAEIDLKWGKNGDGIMAIY